MKKLAGTMLLVLSAFFIMNSAVLSAQADPEVEKSHVKRNWGCGSIKKSQPIYSGVFFSESSCCDKACDKNVNIEYSYNGTDGKALEISYRFAGETNESAHEMSLLLNNNCAIMKTRYCSYKLLIKVVDEKKRITVEEYAWRE